MIIRASELNALGVSGGGMTSVGFMVVTPSGIPLQNFTISLGTTSDSVLSTNAGFVSGMTQVYSVPTYTDVVGWNTHVFAQPFFWNGTTNLIIETCFNNTSWVNNGNAVLQQTDVGYNGTLYFRRDSLGTCTASPAGSFGFFESTQRPNMQFNFLPCTTSITNNINISGCGFAVLSSGDTVNHSGTYIDTLLNSMGCDSILNQIVTIHNPSICNPVPSYVTTNGLVGWWGFNGNAQDGSGNGNHGTVNGATLTTDRFGNQNGAYSFDGVNDFISVNHNQALNLPGSNNSFSFSTWISPNQTNQQELNVLSKGAGNGMNSNDTYIFSVYNRNKIGLELANFPSAFWTYSSDSINFSLWNHVVAVYDNTLNSSKFYINGVLAGQQQYPLIPNSNGDAQPLFFGKQGWNCNCNFMNGLIDDIGIWNRTLTQQEITNLYNSQLPTQTSLCLPTITTITPTSIGIDSVVIGGDILNDGGSSIVSRGVCYFTTPNPNMGDLRTEDGIGIGTYSTILRNLSPSTTYYVRSYAKNSQGVVVYGNEVSFSTGTPIPSFSCGTSTVSDVDGNNYNTVQIGTQCWTQSNLKVSKYRNGDNIPTGLSNTAWQNTTAGAYAIYDNDPVNDGFYGKLYNHFTVTDTRGLCPTGWHVPTDGEWTTLETFLGGSSVAGGALKSTSTQPTPGGWWSPNTGATNSSGFTALPGGLRYGHAEGFNTGIGSSGWWWTSSQLGSLAVYRLKGYWYTNIHQNTTSFAAGLSVRCLRD
jgi:uncharacterized protein (TIGR02145 family)